MAGLIPSTKVSLSIELLDNPFPTLFVAQMPANLSLVGKAEYIKEFSIALSRLETSSEDALNRNHWGSIASGFSAAITIAGSASLIPLAGWILSGVSVVAAAASIGGAIVTKSKVSPVIDNLKRHRLALESQEAIQWAALWEFVGPSLFCRALGYASRGYISGGKLVQPGTDSPFMRAVDFIAECRGMSYEQVIASAGAIKNGTQSAPLPELKGVNLPFSVGQNTKLMAIETEAKLVEDKPLISVQPVEPASGSTFDQSFVKSKPDPVDIALKMAEVPKSTIIAASPRVGKGVVVSMALAHLKKLHPDLEIWLIDPKDEPDERHYWSLIDPDKRCHFDLRDYDLDASEASVLFEAFLIRFNRSRSSRKLLIIDEFVMLNQKCTKAFTDKLKDFIVGICSSGETLPDQGIGRFVWAITQSPYVSDIGFKTKAALTTFQRVFLLNVASIQLYSLAASASFVPSGQDKEVAALLEVTGRAFYYSRSNSWHPVPNYQLSTQPSIQVKSPPVIAQENSQITDERIVETERQGLKISFDLAEPLKSIWLFCQKKNDWVTAKDIYKNDLVALKGKSIKNIRQYLGLLADKGLGEIDEIDGDKPKADSSVGFRAY